MKLPSVTGSSTPGQRSPDNNNNDESNNVNNDIIIIIGERAVKSTRGAYCQLGRTEGTQLFMELTIWANLSCYECHYYNESFAILNSSGWPKILLTKS